MPARPDSSYTELSFLRQMASEEPQVVTGQFDDGHVELQQPRERTRDGVLSRRRHPYRILSPCGSTTTMSTPLARKGSSAAGWAL